MQVWNDVAAVPEDWPLCVVTIGVFDGVHRGHRELIRNAVAKAASSGMPSVALTFSPNPQEVVGRGDPPARISTLQQRLRQLADLGVDATAVIQFDTDVAALTPEQFAGRMLSDQLHTAEVVVGENFRFGHRARGDVKLLGELGESLGFTVSPVFLLGHDEAGEPVSSTVIRRLIAEGNVAAAARALARPHRLEGEVVRGDGRGTDMGLPTANLETTPLAAIPADGVYAGRIVRYPYTDHAESHSAAISIGTNPTFDGDSRRIESFAYDSADMDLYDEHIAVDFVGWIRGQEKFNSEAELITAVERDVDTARTLLGG